MSKVKNGISTEKGFNPTDGTGLTIEKDENGVLKIGDVIIPQKKLIFVATSSPAKTYQMSEANGLTIACAYEIDTELLNKKLMIEWADDDGKHCCIANFTKNDEIVLNLFEHRGTTGDTLGTNPSSIMTLFFGSYKFTVKDNTNLCIWEEHTWITKASLSSNSLGTNTYYSCDDITDIKIYEIIE